MDEERDETEFEAENESADLVSYESTDEQSGDSVLGRLGRSRIGRDCESGMKVGDV